MEEVDTMSSENTEKSPSLPTVNNCDND